MNQKNWVPVLAAMLCFFSMLSACTPGPLQREITAGNSTAQDMYIYILPVSAGDSDDVSAAVERAKEINDAGRYKAAVLPADTAAGQAAALQKILDEKETHSAVVIQPAGDSVLDVMRRLAAAKIPYCVYGAASEAANFAAVSYVTGDEQSIGAGAAAYFVRQGLQPGARVCVFETDDPAAAAMRSSGFTGYLTGQCRFDGKKIPISKRWTKKDVQAITYSGALDRSGAKAYFERLLQTDGYAQNKWFYTQADPLAMGILEALSGGSVDETVKKNFLANQPVISGFGGSEEFAEVLRGNSYTDAAAQAGGLLSVCYSPSLLQAAVQDMLDYLDGKQVRQQHVVGCGLVTAKTVGD